MHNLVPMLIKTLKNNSPTILTTLSAGGVILTTASGVKITPTALRLIEREEKRLGRDLTDYEVLKLCWRLYIPTGLLGSTTITLMFLSNSILASRNTALVEAVGLISTTLNTYREKVREEVGERKEEMIADKIAEDRLNSESPMVILGERSGFLFFEPASGRYFRSTIEEVRSKVNELNHDMLIGGDQSLNDWFYLLGLENTDIGGVIGWAAEDGLLEIRFSTKLTKTGEPCVVFDYMRFPKNL